MDVLAGATLDHMAAAEKQAKPGEVVLGPAILAQMEKKVSVAAWRTDEQGQRYAVIDGCWCLSPFLPPGQNCA
jgi:hypothetical protein